MKRFIRASSPSGYDLGWISADVILTVSSNGRYFTFRGKDRVVDGTVPYGEPEDTVLRALGLIESKAERRSIREKILAALYP